MPTRELDRALTRLGATSSAIRPFGDLHLAQFRSGPGDPVGVPAPWSGFPGLIACATLKSVDAWVDGAPLPIARGDLALFDLATPLVLRTERPATWIALAIPRTSLIDRLAGPPPLPPMRLCRGILSTAYMRACLLCLWRSRASHAGPGLGETEVDLLISALEQGPAQGDSEAARRLRDLLAVASLVQTGLEDPSFDARSLAERAGLSAHALGALVAPLTVKDIIRRSRLTLARRLLQSSTRTQLSVAEVSSRVGIVNVAHFSTSYGAAFGATPTTMRRPC